MLIEWAPVSDAKEILILGLVRAYLKPGACYVEKLFVPPDHRNKGIGKQLMAKVDIFL